jgi:hypothetical protein
MVTVGVEVTLAATRTSMVRPMRSVAFRGDACSTR